VTNANGSSARFTKARKFLFGSIGERAPSSFVTSRRETASRSNSIGGLIGPRHLCWFQERIHRFFRPDKRDCSQADSVADPGSKSRIIEMPVLIPKSDHSLESRLVREFQKNFSSCDTRGCPVIILKRALYSKFFVCRRYLPKYMVFLANIDTIFRTNGTMFFKKDQGLVALLFQKDRLRREWQCMTQRSIGHRSFSTSLGRRNRLASQQVFVLSIPRPAL